MGDGSLLTLVNNSSSYYSGSYVSDSKGSHVRANVYFYEEAEWDYYRNRIVELTMGDGLVYIFKEYNSRIFLLS